MQYTSTRVCPQCLSESVVYRTGMDTVGRQYCCLDCGHQFGLVVESVQQPVPPVTPLYGWVCPKCGRVNAPHVSYCDCPNINSITTDPIMFINTSICDKVPASASTSQNFSNITAHNTGGSKND